MGKLYGRSLPCLTYKGRNEVKIGKKKIIDERIESERKGDSGKERDIKRERKEEIQEPRKIEKIKERKTDRKRTRTR